MVSKSKSYGSKIGTKIQTSFIEFAQLTKKETLSCDENGSSQTSNVTIARSFISHFKALYNGGHKETLLIENLDWHLIANFIHPSLCEPFQEKEIKKAILSFRNNKSPSPDGFPINFYKKKILVYPQERYY